MRQPSFSKSLRYLIVFLTLSVLSQRIWAQAGGEAKPGAIIVLSSKGLVQAIDPQGNVVAGALKPGAVLAEGYSVKTGFGGEAAVLFSNGTIATVEPRTQVKVSAFLQKDFQAGDQKLSEVQQEPSSSQIALDLNTGSLVVQTKKLDRSSNFTINSPLGTAGIRGTEFQMGISPAGETKLDVSSSAVSFTPTGGVPVLISQGKGLDVSPGGIVNQRPIDPVISINIGAKNSAAGDIAGQIPMSTVGLAKQKATALSAVSGGQGSGGEKTKSEDNGDQEGESSEDGEDADSSEAAEAFIDQQSEAFRSVPGAQTGASYLNLILGLANNEFNEFELSADGFLKLGLLSLDSVGQDQFDSILSQDLSGMEVADILAFLNANFEHPVYSNELLAVSLSAFYRIKDEFENDDINDALRGALDLSMLFLDDVTIGSGSLAYSPLDQSSDISSGRVLNASNLVSTGSIGGNPYLYEVGMILAEYGALGGSDREAARNIAINIFDFLGGSDGSLIPASFSLGDENNDKLIGAALLGSERNDLIDPPSDGKGDEGVLDSAAKKKQADGLYKIYRDNVYGVVGADVTVGSSSSDTEVDVSDILTKATRFESDPTDDADGMSNDKKILAFAAAKDLHLKGNVTFANDNDSEDHALILGAGDHVEIESGAKIRYEGSNLGVGSYSSLTLNEVDIDVGGNLAIGSLNDLEIHDSTFSVGRYSDRDNVYLYAENLMKVDGLNFEDRPDADNNRFLAGRAREIYMEAITIDLQKAHFPAESKVMLRSRDGNPNFYGGTGSYSSPFAPGAVNFYQDSNSYGGKAITPAAFTTSPNANPNRQRQFTGYDSIGSDFTTSTGAPGIRIRKFPE